MDKDSATCRQASALQRVARQPAPELSIGAVRGQRGHHGGISIKTVGRNSHCPPRVRNSTPGAFPNPCDPPAPRFATEQRPTVQIVRSDAVLNLSVTASFSGDTFGQSTSSDALRPQVVTGLFAFNPSAGLDFTRRQVALVHGDCPTCAQVTVLTVSDNLTQMSLLGQAPVEMPDTSFDCYRSAHFSVAAGGYAGNGKQQDPRGSIVVSGWRGSLFSVFWLQFGPSGLQVTGQTDTSPAQPVPFDCDARLPIVAHDPTGQSVTLEVGAPVHITVSGLVQTDYILQEPPKHLAYLDLSDGQGPRIVNVSRVPGFNGTGWHAAQYFLRCCAARSGSGCAVFGGVEF